MSIKLGNTSLNKLSLGATDVQKAYLGNTLIYNLLQPNGLLNGLISYYKADTNGSFPDAHGGVNGIISGASYTANGKINGAYSFNGINNKIDLGVGRVNDFTYSVWMTRGDSIVISQFNSYMGLNSAGVVFSNYYDGVDKSISIQAVNDNLMHNVIRVKSSTQGQLLYVDGVLAVSNPTQTSSMIGTYNSGIGLGYLRNWSANWYNGTADEIGYWGRGLTATECASIANNGAGLPYSSFTN